MKSRKYQGSEETSILTALILHDRVLAKIHQHLGKDHKPFRSKYSNIVARLCFDYYEKYQKAPGKTIESLFKKYSQSEQDESAIDLVEKLLSSLSDKYESAGKEINEQWTVDLASRFFDKIRLERVADGITQALERDDLDEAKKLQAGHKPLSFTASDWVDPFNKDEIDATLAHIESDNSLVRFPGALGEFLSPALERGAFVSFVAPEKRGKSFWLQEIVWRALNQRRRVLYYVLGDMSKRAVLTRLYQRATVRPRYTKTIKFPKKIVLGEWSGEGQSRRREADVEYVEREVQGVSSFAVRKSDKDVQILTATKKPLLKLRCAGANVISASMIESDVDEFARAGWVADCVIVDYADLLLPEASAQRQDFRHQIDDTWKILRRISLDKNVLMLTATQASAKSYGAWLIRGSHFSEDKRKNAHVTGMCGINQTSEEKKLGIYRLNWSFLRDGEWTDGQCCWVAGNLKVCAPALKSLM